VGLKEMNRRYKNIGPPEQLNIYQLFKDDRMMIFRIGDETFYRLEVIVGAETVKNSKIYFSNIEDARKAYRSYCRHGWKTEGK
jgi:hypothetical protein